MVEFLGGLSSWLAEGHLLVVYSNGVDEVGEGM